LTEEKGKHTPYSVMLLLETCWGLGAALEMAAALLDAAGGGGGEGGTQSLSGGGTGRDDGFSSMGADVTAIAAAAAGAVADAETAAAAEPSCSITTPCDD